MKLSKFSKLILVSVIGFVISVVLHNLFYALAILTKDIKIFSALMELLEVLFFLIAVFACPIGFLVGAAGNIVMFIKKKRG